MYLIVIKKISEAFAKLQQLEDNENQKEEKFWKDLNDLKLPMYLIIEDSKSFSIILTMKFLNNSAKNKKKIFTKRRQKIISSYP